MRTSLSQMHTPHSGFTLIETLVAITILLLVIIGPMTIAQKGVQNAYYANEETTAVFLAQEAIEGARKLRDEAALTAYDVKSNSDPDDSFDTMSWIPSCTPAVGGCSYDVESGTFTTCGTNDDCGTLEVASNGKYVVNGGEPSKFKRRVYIQNNSLWASVRADVTWDSNINTGGSVQIRSYIYDHYRGWE